MTTVNASGLAILLFSAFLGCSSHQQETTKTGIVRGHISIGPLRPGPVRRDQPEPEPPAELYAAHKIAVLSMDAETKIQEIAIDRSGNYEATLPAGKYLLDFVPHDIGGRSLPPTPVTIEEGQTATVDFDIDTGMR